MNEEQWMMETVEIDRETIEEILREVLQINFKTHTDLPPLNYN